MGRGIRLVHQRKCLPATGVEWCCADRVDDADAAPHAGRERRDARKIQGMNPVTPPGHQRASPNAVLAGQEPLHWKRSDNLESRPRILPLALSLHIEHVNLSRMHSRSLSYMRVPYFASLIIHLEDLSGGSLSFSRMLDS